MAQYGNGRPEHAFTRLPPDQPVETGRFLDALRRSKLLILVIVVALTAAVVAVSLTLPPRYRATAKIVLASTADPLQTRDVESVERRLATIEALLTTRDTRRRAARRTPGETAATLEGKVSSSVDPRADIVSISATDETAAGAARIANAVATSFLNQQRRAEQRRLGRARAALTTALARLEGRRGLQAQEERAQIQQQLTDLELGAAGAGTELALAEAAQRPTQPYSPRPARNAIFGLFASLFVAALVVLARAQLKPRVTGSRELSGLLDLPVLAEVPHVRRPLGHQRQTLSSAEYEAYQTLQASIRRLLPPTGQRTLLVTSALHGEGKTEVTAALGLVLSQAMHRTWLVSADMRRPRLHELFDVDQTPGLSEVLVGARNGGSEGIFQLTASRTGSGTLHVLASGRTPPDPAQLLASDALDGFFGEIGDSDYDYVVLDGPPLLGLVDSQVLAQRVDGVLIVCHPDRHTPETATALRELLERLEVKPLGVVIVGTRGRIHSYLPG
ncbi:MAG TPA: Wzz/FepE/Etk N-terminal domain-containing protein [Gaiellaceae bacterium]|nr:Wzz/FepE/Etk N-terminal domain-containing protein [Gaiellaceae bacterium]